MNKDCENFMDHCGTYYLNDDKTYRKCSVTAFGLQMEKMRKSDTKHVAKDDVNGKRVSTVWLGIDHQFGEYNTPILFETMVFEGNSYSEIYCKRYTSWDDAVNGHKEAVQWVKDGCDESNNGAC